MIPSLYGKLFISPVPFQSFVDFHPMGERWKLFNLYNTLIIQGIIQFCMVYLRIKEQKYNSLCFASGASGLPMLLIPCPWCGDRAESEFRCAGPVRYRRSDMLELNDQSWIEYLCSTDSQRGLVIEHWHHEKGCGEWFRLGRDTVTNTISPVD